MKRSLVVLGSLLIALLYSGCSNNQPSSPTAPAYSSAGPAGSIAPTSSARSDIRSTNNDHQGADSPQNEKDHSGKKGHGKKGHSEEGGDDDGSGTTTVAGCAVQTDGSVTVTLVSISLQPDGQFDLKFAINNSCTSSDGGDHSDGESHDKKVSGDARSGSVEGEHHDGGDDEESNSSYVAFELPAGCNATSPGATYTSPSGRTYKVENPASVPFYSIRFDTENDLSNEGQPEYFEFTTSAVCAPLPTMRVAVNEGSTLHTVAMPTTNCLPQPICPTITAVNPTSPTVGNVVTITGTDFGATQGSSVVSVGSVVATIQSWSGTTIQVIAPSSVGNANVIVTVNGCAGNPVPITILAPCPVLSSITPTSGMWASTVSISGMNFGSTQGSSVVLVDSTAAPVVSWSDVQIQFTVPYVPIGNRLVSVVVNGCKSNTLTYTVIAPPPLRMGGPQDDTRK